MTSDVSQVLKRYNYLLSETNAAYHDAACKLGLSDSSMIVLYTICDMGDPCPLREICRSAGISKQTVNSALRKLEADGMIYLKNTDGKNKNVCLTEEGQKFSEQTVRKIIKMENDIFASWAKEDVEQYLALTERYLQDFKAQLPFLMQN